MTLKIGWLHEAEQSLGTWLHEADDWQPERHSRTDPPALRTAIQRLGRFQVVKERGRHSPGSFNAALPRPTETPSRAFKRSSVGRRGGAHSSRCPDIRIHAHVPLTAEMDVVATKLRAQHSYFEK